MHNHIEKKLGIVFAISIFIFVVELVGGFLSNSLALITDSLHVLLDFTAIGISLLAFRIAKRPHSSKMTFGFHRIEIVAAFVNGISLVIVATVIFFEAYRRFLEPPQVNINLLIGFALLGLCANVVMIALLKKDSRSNLNIKGSYIHVIGDLLSSLGVVIGGIIMFFVNYYVIDVIVSLAIGLLIVRSGVILCRECLHIFMEGTPHEIKLSSILDQLKKIEGISDVHDLHVWTLTSNVFAMSVHIKIKDEFVLQSGVLLRKINEMMKDEFGINHCTTQIESEHDIIQPDKSE